MVKRDKEKLKILAAGDLHGSPEIAEELAKKAEKEKVDLIVLAGDLHGMFENQSKIVMKPFKDRKQKVAFVPGNWDTSLEASLLREEGAKNLHGYYVNYKGINILGVGNPDFKLSLDNDGLDKLKYNFQRFKKKGRSILVSHLHAAGSKAEFSGFKGDSLLRKAIDYFHPDILIQGHIHEAEGIEEKIGKTKVINVGRRGKVIEI
ncbi:MAG: metallophosphoesterase family protein [Candidatus Nanoarchaeia archaeon]